MIVICTVMVGGFKHFVCPTLLCKFPLRRKAGESEREEAGDVQRGEDAFGG